MINFMHELRRIGEVSREDYMKYSFSLTSVSRKDILVGAQSVYEINAVVCRLISKGK